MLWWPLPSSSSPKCLLLVWPCCFLLAALIRKGVALKCFDEGPDRHLSVKNCPYFPVGDPQICYVIKRRQPEQGMRERGCKAMDKLGDFGNRMANFTSSSQMMCVGDSEEGGFDDGEVCVCLEDLCNVYSRAKKEELAVQLERFVEGRALAIAPVAAACAAAQIVSRLLV